MSKYLFRGLRVGETSVDGLTAKRSTSRDWLERDGLTKSKIENHIVKGNISDTCYISFTEDLGIAKKHASEVFFTENRTKNFDSMPSIDITGEETYIKDKNIVCNGRKNKIVVMNRKLLHSAQIDFYDKRKIEQITKNKRVKGTRNISKEVLIFNNVEANYIEELPWLLVDILTSQNQEEKKDKIICKYLTDVDGYINKLIDLDKFDDQQLLIFYLAYIKEYSTYEIAATIFELLDSDNISAHNLMAEIKLIKNNIINILNCNENNVKNNYDNKSGYPLCMEKLKKKIKKNKTKAIKTKGIEIEEIETKKIKCLENLGNEISANLENKTLKLYLTPKECRDKYQVVKYCDNSNRYNNYDISYLFFKRTLECIESSKIEEATKKATGSYVHRERFVNIIIPEGIKMIGEKAFANCRGLMYIHLPETLRKIGDNAFKNCENLHRVTLPEGIVEIGKSSFKRCIRLLHINLPNSLMKIGEKAFKQCACLQGIIIPEKIKVIEKGLLDFSGQMFGSSLQIIKIPKHLEIIHDNAFRGCGKLGEISITNEPEGNESCSNLGAYLPETLEYIGENAFCSCGSLQKIRIPKHIKCIKKGTFSFCTSLEQILLPEGLDSIEESAFHHCTELAEIILPKEIIKIDKEAFRSCTKLKNIVLPEKISEIKERTFFECTELEEISFCAQEVTLEDYIFGRCNALKDINFTGRLTKMGAGVFENCKSLTNVDFINDLSEICGYVFKGCAKLKSITIPEGVQKIGAHAFESCTSLRDIAIPKDVEGILSSTFKDCTELKTVTLHGKIKFVSEKAFANCIKLESICIQGEDIIIYEKAFLGCTSLEMCEVSGKTITIGNNTFLRCISLEIFKLAGEVIEIEDNAFSECTKLVCS